MSWAGHSESGRSWSSFGTLTAGHCVWRHALPGVALACRNLAHVTLVMTVQRPYSLIQLFLDRAAIFGPLRAIKLAWGVPTFGVCEAKALQMPVALVCIFCPVFRYMVQFK